MCERIRLPVYYWQARHIISSKQTQFTSLDTSRHTYTRCHLLTVHSGSICSYLCESVKWAGHQHEIGLPTKLDVLMMKAIATIKVTL